MVTAHDLCRIHGFKEADGARRYMHRDHRPTRGGGPGRGLARVAAGAARLGSCASRAATDVVDTSGALVARAGLGGRAHRHGRSRLPPDPALWAPRPRRTGLGGALV